MGKEAQEKIGDDIYESLKEIEKEEEVKLSDRAFIADCLSQKLWELGYRKPLDRPALEKAIADIISDARLTAYQDGKTGVTAFRIGNISFEKRLLALIVPKDIEEAVEWERERVRNMLQFDSLKFRMSADGDYEIWLTNGQWQALKGEK